MRMNTLTRRISIMSWDELRVPLFAQWKTWWLSRHPVEIGEYTWAFLFERGKQIRAHLFCELWNYLCPDRPPCIEIAFIIECIHVVSLILDDLPWMDHANERRGWKTLHFKFSIRKALLIAHDVLELAYQVGNSQPLLQKEKGQLEMWYWWGQTKTKILWYGQWLDLSRSGDLEELAKMKTGILFECVSELVATFVGLDPFFWREWGKTLGILFQWIDDWKDREEDRIIQQRNAFNESYDWTMARYTELWARVVQGIGKGWWNRPFGNYLWNYFTVLYSHPPLISEQSSLSLLIHLFGTPSPSLDCSSIIFPHSITPSLHIGLFFMGLFLPYLNQTTIPIESLEETVEEAEEWSLTKLWTIEESQWMNWLETRAKIKPFLLTLRHIERMVQTVSK